MTRCEEREILIACVLGDGCINCSKPHGSAAASLRLTHAPKQYDYLMWKVKLIEGLRLSRGRKFRIHPYIVRLKETGKEYMVYCADLHYTRYLRILHKWLYVGGRKSVKYILRYISSPIALAIWFMDDGCLVRRKKKHKDGTTYFLKPQSYLCTNCFPYDEVLMISQHLEKTYGIKGMPHFNNSGWRLWFDKENTQKIWELISPYVMQIPSMQEKFDLCVKFYSPLSNSSARHPISDRMMI